MTALSRVNLPPWASRLAPLAVIILIQQVAFPVSIGILISGIVAGFVSALMAAGLSLVWRRTAARPPVYDRVAHGLDGRHSRYFAAPCLRLASGAANVG